MRIFAFIPKKLALERLGRKYPEYTKLLTVNPLPDSFEIVPWQRGDALSIEAILRSFGGVLNVTASDACAAIPVLRVTPKALSPEEMKALAREVKRRLASARTKKRHLITANRMALDALPRFKGSRLLVESQNAESDTNVSASATEVRLDLLARTRLPGEDYETLTAQGWGTFRTYSVPAGTTPLAVYDFFTKHLAAHWTLVHEESDPSRPAPYRVDFQRGKRCLWFLIGLRNDGSGALPIGRTFEVGTDQETPDLPC